MFLYFRNNWIIAWIIAFMVNFYEKGNYRLIVIYAELELYLLRANDYDLVSFCISFAFYINLLKKWIYLPTLVYVFTLQLQCGKHTITILFINLTFLIRIIFLIITKITHNSVKCKSRLKATIWLPFALASSLRK